MEQLENKGVIPCQIETLKISTIESRVLYSAFTLNILAVITTGALSDCNLVLNKTSYVI